MPPSRIAFALGDAINEIRRLLPVDTKSTVVLGLDPGTFARVERELKSYGAGAAVAPDGPWHGREVMRLTGMLVVKLRPEECDG